MRKRLKLWQSKLNTAKAKFTYALTFLDFVLLMLNHYLPPKEQWVVDSIYWLAILIIPVAIAGILLWMYIDTRRELKAQKPRIKLTPLHSLILDKKSNTIGIERFYDMLISTLDCPKYKKLTVQLNNVHYFSEKESGHVCLSPPIVLLCLDNVKPDSYYQKDVIHFWSTTKKAILANQFEIKLKKGIGYETEIEFSDDKGVIGKKYYQIQLKQHTDLITDLAIEEFEVFEMGAENE